MLLSSLFEKYICFKRETSVWGLRECLVLRSVWVLVGFPVAVE